MGKIAINMQPGQTKNYKIQLNRTPGSSWPRTPTSKLAATARVRYDAGGKTITSKKALKLVG